MRSPSAAPACHGTGKTSLLPTLSGWRAPASGGVLLAGRPLASFQRLDRAPRLGILLQDETADFWGSALLMARHEPALAARHCEQAVLLYDPARIEHGPANALLTRVNLEALYQCRLEPAAGFFVPLAR